MSRHKRRYDVPGCYRLLDGHRLFFTVFRQAFLNAHGERERDTFASRDIFMPELSANDYSLRAIIYVLMFIIVLK